MRLLVNPDLPLTTWEGVSLAGTLLHNDPLLQFQWVLFDIRLFSCMNSYKLIVSWNSLTVQWKCFSIRFLTICSPICRYQPENSLVAYEMASTLDEADSSNTEMLQDDSRTFGIKNLLCTSKTEPSHQSGFIVNICTSALGQWKPRKRRLSSPKPCWRRRLGLSPLQVSWRLPSAS